MADVTAPRPLLETDNRSRFDCGRESLNQWFQRHAWTNHAAGISRTNVICDAVTEEIAGYVTLSAAQIERAFLPKSQQRNKPDGAERSVQRTSDHPDGAAPRPADEPRHGLLLGSATKTALQTTLIPAICPTQIILR